MTNDAIFDLWRRYIASELTLDAAGRAVFDHIQAGSGGFSVDFGGIPESQHERVWALMGYLKWRALTEAGAPIPRPATDAEFAAIGAEPLDAE